jgi:hypothetical protein
MQYLNSEEILAYLNKNVSKNDALTVLHESQSDKYVSCEVTNRKLFPFVLLTKEVLEAKPYDNGRKRCDLQQLKEAILDFLAQNRKYRYYQVIQENWGTGWEDSSEYEVNSSYTHFTRNERKLFRHDKKEYQRYCSNVRVINRKVKQ